MTLPEILTLMFSTGNAVGMILNVRRVPAGWAVVAFAQGSMAAYLIVTGQWRQGLPQFICLVISLWGLWDWTRKRKLLAAERAAGHEG